MLGRNVDDVAVGCYLLGAALPPRVDAGDLLLISLRGGETLWRCCINKEVVLLQLRIA